ncbi:MAG TPA: hypothetical protein VKB86_10660, partial [Pyrinomonadaceae bacterium]|nr:hypothetical protein [Pyrinomonadaceae bacterium]
NNVEVSYINADFRPAFALEDVKGVDFFRVKARKAEGALLFSLKNVSNFSVEQSQPIADMRIERTEQKKF